ncbi:hypothetical protein AABB24_038952 [Solanum stoloniferum]|uniref:Uncharacterized protein n=1 Tax=Solanum stoloniferum TaxID=62892 RepID=A0ABD2R2E2_9SOLN
MNSSMYAGKDQGKKPAETSSDSYLQAFLRQTHFTPISGPDGLRNKMFDRLFFGTQSLIAYPDSNLTFRQKARSVTDRTQKCLLDNLWISFNKTPRDNAYFISVLNSLTHYFTERNQEKNLKFYTVTRGKKTGVFQT